MIQRLLILGLCLLVPVAGCTSAQVPTYQAVKTEFAPACPLPSGEKPPEKPVEVSGPLTLRRAIGYALSCNPNRQAALFRIQSSEAMVDQTLAAFLPRITAYGGYSRGDAPSAYLFKLIDQRNLAPFTNFNDPGTFQNFEVGIKGGWNLYRGGRDLLARRMAETGLTISRLDSQSVANALAASVTKTFYNCLAARDMVGIARESVQTVARQLKVMRVRQQAGGALKSDVLSLEVRLAQAREGMVRARNNYRLSLAALANLMGADLDSQFQLSQDQGVDLVVPPDYRQGLEVALALRPELLKARHQVVRARMGLESVRGEYLPTLDAQGSYYLDSDTLHLETDGANWAGGIILNWDLFTGFSTRSGERRARADLAAMLARDRQTTQRVQLEVKSAYLNLQAAQARLAVSRASVARARESLKLVTRQYEGGSAGITRYLDAELALSRARVRYTAARYDTAKARSDIARALGLWASYTREEDRRHVQKRP